jgi:hypothetical protein
MLSYGFADSKNFIVLQCGSDWCESGKDVRRVFESKEFRSALGNKYEFAVYDDMDNPPPEVAAKNKDLSKWRVESLRFPAITCLESSNRRFYAQLENIPFDVNPKKLASDILLAAKKVDEVKALFKKAEKEKNELKAAEAYAKGFAILFNQVGSFNEKRLWKGALAWRKEWDAFSKLDSDDKYGFRFRFTSGVGIAFVEKATKFRTDGDLEGGKKYIASLRSIPSANLTVVQRQAIEIAEYALWRKDSKRVESNKVLLRHALDLGRDTLWGQCALGYLRLLGENIPRREVVIKPLRPRPNETQTVAIPFPLDKIENKVMKILERGTISKDDRHTIALYGVLSRIGNEGWNELCSRQGAKAFMDAFFTDCQWIEDFIWSGKCDNWRNALLALETLYFQDNGRWIKGDNVGRRFATAVALSHPDKSESWLSRLLDAYRSTAEEKRLHSHALTQGVWEWRYAIEHTCGGSFAHGANKYRNQYVEQLPEQQLELASYVNVPHKAYERMHWRIPYRSFNCFGENVQGAFYYESWLESGEYTLRKFTPDVGGVCGELSKFGSGCANAHGLASAPVGQPRHCAFARRLFSGEWDVCNYIGAPTGFSSLFPFRSDKWTYSQAHEDTFEGNREKRLDAARWLEIAHYACSKNLSSDKIVSSYNKSFLAYPSYYLTWRDYSEWIIKSKAPLNEHRKFVESCLHKLKSYREPLWDLLSPYFSRVSKELGNEALAEELERMMPLLRQCEEKIREEGSFGKILASWMRPLEKNASLKERVLTASLKAQYGTQDYFTQVITSFSDSLVADVKMFDRIAKVIEKFLADKKIVGTQKGIDFGALILKASQSGNEEVFRQLSRLQRMIPNENRKGDSYP